MRTFVVISALLALQAVAKDPERIPAAGGQTIIKEFYKDGTIKTLTRVESDGRLVGIQYYTPTGRATHCDYFDDKKRVRRSVFYREDGTPKSAKVFDEHGKVVLEQWHDKAGYVVKQHVVK